MDEKILIMNRGDLELSYPADWELKVEEGIAKLMDPGDNCLLEVSYMRLPPLPTVPPIEQFLLLALRDQAAPDAVPESIRVEQRPLARLAWYDYVYHSLDSERGIEREAHGRWTIAANHLFQALLTFYYWTDDADWAVPAWEGIYKSLRLGYGERLASPWDHWSMRPKS